MDNITIDKFDGTDYRFLSNFFLCDVIYDGIQYKHTEGAFQAQKTLNIEERKQLAKLSPSQVKKAAGRHGNIKLRDDWEQVKDKVMERVLVAKFTQNPELEQKLLATGDRELVEGNTWHDNYWGDCKCARCKDKPGKNMLGKLLMQIRDELRGEE